jgi:hypothetical protein
MAVAQLLPELRDAAGVAEAGLSSAGAVVGDDVVEGDDTAGADEGGEHLEVLGDSGVGVVAVNEEKIERLAVEKPFDAGAGGGVVGVGLDQRQALAMSRELREGSAAGLGIAPVE